MLFYLSCTKHCQVSPLLLDLMVNPRWQPRQQPCLVTSQASSSTTHMKHISSCRKDQRLSIEGKIFSKYCNISREGFHQSRPPPPSVLVLQGSCLFKRTSNLLKKKHFLPVKIPSLIILAPLLILHKLNCKLPHLHTDHSVIEECSKETRRHLWSFMTNRHPSWSIIYFDFWPL